MKQVLLETGTQKVPVSLESPDVHGIIFGIYREMCILHEIVPK